MLRDDLVERKCYDVVAMLKHVARLVLLHPVPPNMEWKHPTVPESLRVCLVEL